VGSLSIGVISMQRLNLMPTTSLSRTKVQPARGIKARVLTNNYKSKSMNKKKLKKKLKAVLKAISDTCNECGCLDYGGKHSHGRTICEESACHLHKYRCKEKIPKRMMLPENNTETL
jgi:hypothetical protein